MYRLLLISLFSTSILFAQQDTLKSYNRFSIDGGFGLGKGLKTFTNGYSMKFSPLSLNLGVRYMFNQKFGLKLDMGYDNLLKSSSSLDYTAQYTRGSIQGVANLATIFNFNKFTSSFGLLGHVGTGFSALCGKDFGLIKKADNTINIIVGLTPQYKVNERVALYIDLSYTTNLLSDYNYDLKSRIVGPGKKSTSSLLNTSLGISYKIGKAEKHYDWIMERIIPIQDSVKAQTTSIQDTTKKETKPVVEGGVAKEVFEDTLNVGKTIETIKNIEGKPTKTVVSVNANTQSINGMNGLFYTVQIGAYNYYMKVESHKKLESVYMITLPDGKVRFCTGVFANEKDAYKLLYKARELGFSDAFLTAYYNGIRIPVFKARELLRVNGPSIIDPAVKK